MTSFLPGSGSRLRLILVVINEYDASAIYASNLCANGDVELALLLWIQPYPVALRTNNKNGMTSSKAPHIAGCLAIRSRNKNPAFATVYMYMYMELTMLASNLRAKMKIVNDWSLHIRHPECDKSHPRRNKSACSMVNGLAYGGK